jgi:flagellar hook protein FlgE
MINAISIALGGLAVASRNVEESAARIAVAADPDANVDLAQELVNIKISETAFKANLASIKTAEAMSDELLHIFDKKV